MRSGIAFIAFIHLSSFRRFFRMLGAKAVAAALWVGALFLACSAALLLAVPPAWAQTQSVLYAFQGTPDGKTPTSGVVFDALGNLYGVTRDLGARNNGTLYKLAPDGTESTLYSFVVRNGANPSGVPVLDSQGNIYGTTAAGGAHQNQGTVYQVTPGGVETVLYSFTKKGGYAPTGDLIRDEQGNLYGTAALGGLVTAECPRGCGTVFKLSPSGTETVLYEFTGGADGGNPLGGLVADSQGNFYGTTSDGGTLNFGTVFKLTPAGVESVLYSFKSGTDGRNPYGRLTRDAKGNLYGATEHGGGSTNPNCFGNGCGVIFKVTPAGKGKVLFAFSGGPDGGTPNGGLVFDSLGNLFGTTFVGGVFNSGTLFKLSPFRHFSAIYSFTGGADGGNPNGDLVFDAQGNLYGTTANGGANKVLCPCGVVFKLTP
jgi:uncharacterized repeat protein (TIGR03803 family)